jgi:hypothetical protein
MIQTKVLQSLVVFFIQARELFYKAGQMSEGHKVCRIRGFG